MYLLIYLYIILDCSRHVVRDVVFVVDTSSHRSSEFQLIRELIEDIIIYLKLSTPETLFGLITYDNVAQLEFNISKYTDLTTLLPAINLGLSYSHNDGTNTGNALRLLLSGSVEGGFLQLRENTSKVAIVITDGYLTDSSSLRSAASSLHAANIFDVYAIGINHDNIYNIRNLQLIANDQSFVFYTNSFHSVTAQQLRDDVINMLCYSKHTCTVVYAY